MTKTNNYHHDAARCLGGYSMHCVGAGGRRLRRGLGMAGSISGKSTIILWGLSIVIHNNL